MRSPSTRWAAVTIRSQCGSSVASASDRTTSRARSGEVSPSSMAARASGWRLPSRSRARIRRSVAAMSRSWAGEHAYRDVMIEAASRAAASNCAGDHWPAASMAVMICSCWAASHKTASSRRTSAGSSGACTKLSMNAGRPRRSRRVPRTSGWAEDPLLRLNRSAALASPEASSWSMPTRKSSPAVTSISSARMWAIGTVLRVYRHTPRASWRPIRTGQVPMIR